MVAMVVQILFANVRYGYCHFYDKEINCNHFIFFFQDVTQNVNWNKCLDVNGMSLARCIYNCEDNGDCENECVAQFKGRTADCPCEVSLL